MSEVALATPYAPGNYRKGLNNLVKRYEKDDTEIHYKDVSFNELSEDQARAALKFFGDIELIDITKRGHYRPPDEVVTWISSVDGPIKKEAKEKVEKRLSEYEVYDWIKFLLEDSERELESLVTDIGGNIGVSEDDLSRLKRTIEVFAAIEFLEIDDENNVKLLYDVAMESSSKDSSSQQNSKQERPENLDVSYDSNSELSEGDQIQTNSQNQTQNAAIDLSVSLDATEMNVEDLREKLAVIKEVLGDDAE